MSPALNGSSAIQCFEGNDAIELHNGISTRDCILLCQLFMKLLSCHQDSNSDCQSYTHISQTTKTFAVSLLKHSYLNICIDYHFTCVCCFFQTGLSSLSRTDCVFSPDEQLIMTGTSVRKGQVRAVMVWSTVRHALRWISFSLFHSFPLLHLPSFYMHPSCTNQGSGKLMFYDKDLKQVYQLPVSDSVSFPRISIWSLVSYNSNVIDN